MFYSILVVEDYYMKEVLVMIKSGKIFFKSFTVIAAFLLVFCTATKVTFANEVLTTPKTENASVISTEISSKENFIDVQEMKISPFYTESLPSLQLAPDFSSPNANANIQALPTGPVWKTTDYVVTQNGRTVTAKWTIATNSIIRTVNASFNTGAGWTDTTSFKGPNAGGVTLEQTWTYEQAGTYRVGGVAQILTDKGYASCTSPTRVVYIQ